MPKLQSINPSNYEVIGEVEISTEQDIIQKFNLAKKAQSEWQNISLEKRLEYLAKTTEILKAKKDEFILLESREMGMPINDASADFDAGIDYIKWYLDNAIKYLSPEITFENETEIHKVFHEPIGVVAVITPWNFPLNNFIWGSFQNLIAGNTIVLKHSEECPLCGKFIENIFSTNLPEGVFNEVYGDSEVGKILIAQDIDMIMFTGSTKTGKFLYKTAGEKFIKAVMELGGSAPGIIFEDANIDSAVENICFNRLFNSGQCCDGLKRLIVHKNIFNEIVEKLSIAFGNKKMGTAENPNTELGPLVSKKQLDLLISQVEDAKIKGANIAIGGNTLENKFNGAFFEPTILTNITKDMKVWTEEVFGPVLPIITFETDEEAVALANDTTYGLGSYLYTSNSDRINKISNELQTGMISVNGVNYILPCNPFGGYKNSGFGREHGKYGFDEVTQIKLIAKNK